MHFNWQEFLATIGGQAALLGVVGYLIKKLVTSRLEREADGGLIVRFRAGGVQEMCWHLFTWGTGVRVVGPDCLQSTMIDIASIVTKHHSLP